MHQLFTIDPRPSLSSSPGGHKIDMFNLIEAYYSVCLLDARNLQLLSPFHPDVSYSSCSMDDVDADEIKFYTHIY